MKNLFYKSIPAFAKLLVVFLFLNCGSIAQTAQYPYPIIFVHGLNSNANTWNTTINTLGGQVKIFDVCLNHDGINATSILDNDVVAAGWRDLNPTVPSPTRLYAISFDNEPMIGHESHDLSNQAAIYKQGKALKLMITLVLSLENTAKVILVGHSMGGLAIREYLQRTIDGTTGTSHTWWINPNPGGHKVAKVVTIGTPHLGSNSTLGGIWPGLDENTEAVRDLRYSYNFGTIIAPYLFGSLESIVPNLFYNKDVNCNGSESDVITGVSNGTSDNLNMPLPQDIPYTWITSDILGFDGDGIVDIDRQWLYNEFDVPTPDGITDTLLTNKNHLAETSDIHSIVRGLDEPDNYQLAYIINNSKKYIGFITYQTNYQVNDSDYFKFIASSNGKLKITVDGSNSGVNEIKLLDYNGNLINSQVIQSFPFLYQRDVTAGLYYVVISGNSPGGSALNPYTILPQLEPLIIQLYNGSVTPITGDITTNFNFEVYYKNTNGVAPDNLQLHIINQFSSNMTPNGSNWQQGVQFTKSLNNFAVGQYQYYFNASVNGQTLRLPDTGYLNFSVTQNVAGWDLGVVPEGSYLTPSSITPGTTIQVHCDIHNYSNPGNTYFNVPLNVELRSPSGQLLDQIFFTIPSLTSNNGQLYTLNLNCPSNAINGNYSVIITVFPNVDSNPINNSHTLNFYIGPSIGTELYETEESEIFLYIDETFNACGNTFKLVGVSGGNQATIQEPSGTLRTINEEHIRLFTSYNCAIAVASVGSNYASIRVLCAISSGGPSFLTKVIIGYPGQQNIYFDVEAPTGRTFLSTSGDYGDIFTTGSLTNLPRDWFDGINLYNSAHNVKIRFDIPTSATIGDYDFYQPTPYVGSSFLDHFTKVRIMIIAQPPIVNSLSSYTFSADDQITITGTGFGTTGSIKFNSLTASQIVSWTTTQIKVIVPVGVQSGNLFVVNSNGTSNGMAYTVNSSTGEPIIVAPIPDQSIYQGEIKFIANLNSVFSDPNNQVLTFTATSSNPNVLVLQDSLSVKKLYLNALVNATGNSNISVTATDPTSKSITDQFILTILSNQQAFITITSPNGGENWAIGSQHSINWTSNFTSGNVKIEITRDMGNSWEILFATTPDDGIENWIVNGPITNNVKIKISDIDNSPSDLSDNSFNIIPQNSAPTLTWTGELGYESDGVNPNEGNITNTFTFRAKYTDVDGDAPQTNYPILHLKKNGTELATSPYIMTEANTDPFTTGRIYTVDITNLETGTDYTYYFEARDANNNPATGVATIPKSGPNVIELFTELNLLNLPGTYNGEAIWGDYDNDNDLDILLTGAGVMSIYRNDGSETFNLANIPSFRLFQVCSVDWGDYDNDGDLDIVVAGYSAQFGYKSIVYKNTGNDSFTEIDAGLYPLAYGAVKWGDYDNNGDLDIVLTGNGTGMYPITRIYKNDSEDIFTLISSPNVTNVSGSSCDWGDYDNDKDLDLLISGRVSGSEIVTFIHRNDGGGNFTIMDAIDLTGGWIGSVEWGDYDSNGDLDILVTGSNTSGSPQTRIYRNNGSDVFQDITPALLPQLTDSDTDCGDFDNDGDLDFILSGWNGSSEITRLFRNEGNNNFTVVSNVPFIDLRYSSLDWGDFDNDGDLDLLINGSASSISYSKVYRNNTSVVNNIPAAPDNLSANIITNNEVELNWSKVSNDETSQNGLTYNLVVGTTPGGNEVLSPMANRTNGFNGFRRISDLGNTNHNNQWNIKDLEPGTYYWSVQAVDNCFKGSGFATEQSFIITANESPTLTWTGETGYETDGVDPNEGNTSSQFTFRVKYTDADGDAPLTGFPKVHIKKGGVEIENSPFTMTEFLEDGPQGSKNISREDDVEMRKVEKGDSEILPESPMGDGYLEGVIYEYLKGGLEAGTDYTYYFEAYDINNNLATGEAIVEQGFIVTPPLTNHFTKVWTGNPYNPMNIYIALATLDGLNLGNFDEIGIYDGEYCVGVTVLTGPIDPLNPIQIVTSTDDPGTPEVDGFINGHTIIYRLWDYDNQLEISLVMPTYTLGNGTFVSQGDALVELEGLTSIVQNIDLIGSWNIFSLMVRPDNLDMLNVVNPLIVADVLVKVQDENGNAIIELPAPIGWKNYIGDWSANEGYYIKLNFGHTFTSSGIPIQLPITIPLDEGWNIISYPAPVAQDAMDVVQPLITSDQLIKVQDESGNAIVKLPAPIGWRNYIGDFEPGEGYYLKMNTVTSLTIDEPVILAKGKWNTNKEKTVIKPEHYKPGYTGNPYQPMNIYVELGNIEGIEAGNEIAVFDGLLCVGVIVVEEELAGNDISIIVGMDDPFTEEKDGFSEGNQVELLLWDGEKEEILVYEVITENQHREFQARGTILLKLVSIGVEEEKLPTEYALMNNYPNPFNPETTIEYGIPKDSDVRLIVYNLLGEEVMTLVNEKQVAGWYKVRFDANRLSSGVYLYRIIIDDFVQTKKLILLR
jgi:pimeloyl-ACP methyl ester carboxylesterase